VFVNLPFINMAVVDKNQGFLRGIYLNNAYQGSHLRGLRNSLLFAY
jgi:hypothetical protein